MLCVSVFVLRFPLFCKFVFVFCRSSDEVEGVRAPIIPIDVLHKLQKRFTVSFPLAFSISPNTPVSRRLKTNH